MLCLHDQLHCSTAAQFILITFNFLFCSGAARPPNKAIHGIYCHLSERKTKIAQDNAEREAEVTKDQEVPEKQAEYRLG